MQPLTQPSIADAIYALYTKKREQEPPRNYLGASEIGKECERALWYSFRHAAYPDFSGRMLRLFHTGHREEDRMVAELKEAGFDVIEKDPSTGEQFEIEAFGGHFQGHFDGLIRGVPDAPKQWHILELKTASLKQYKYLAYSKCEPCGLRVLPGDKGECPECGEGGLEPARGVEEAKAVHAAQMQVYMGFAEERWQEWGLDGDPPKAALYLAHCKNDEQLWPERIHYSEREFFALGAKAKRIIEAEAPPEPVAYTPDYYLCGWCDFRDICHGDSIPRVDCRTCVHATPDTSGEGWICERHDGPLGDFNGCPDHLYIPPLLERVLGDVVDYDRSGEGQEQVDWIEYSTEGGVRVRNATVPAQPDSEGLTSREIYERNNQEGE